MPDTRITSLFRSAFEQPTIATRSARLLAVLVAPLAAAPLAGCAVYATPVVSAPANEVYIRPAPPPLIQETITVQPAIGMVWLPGYWHWGGSRYVWRNGYWSHPQPRRGNAGRWQRR